LVAVSLTGLVPGSQRRKIGGACEGGEQAEESRREKNIGKFLAQSSGDWQGVLLNSEASEGAADRDFQREDPVAA